MARMEMDYNMDRLENDSGFLNVLLSVFQVEGPGSGFLLGSLRMRRSWLPSPGRGRSGSS